MWDDQSTGQVVTLRFRPGGTVKTRRVNQCLETESIGDPFQYLLHLSGLFEHAKSDLNLPVLLIVTEEIFYSRLR